MIKISDKNFQSEFSIGIQIKILTKICNPNFQQKFPTEIPGSTFPGIFLRVLKNLVEEYDAKHFSVNSYKTPHGKEDQNY